MKSSKEEKELLNSVEKGEWKQVTDFKAKSAKYKQIAESTERKDKRVNIRITERDLIHLQKKALKEGLPYQSLISSILHKYINGYLSEKQINTAMD
ncbi:MAG: antitoxin [Candidatus Delongbacteria bacterium]|nr:antitoxin [Candidatus Delongbacteria bacterium]MCG2759935.1 antitoxin [Candidatus Delongbacteria bacterium]